MVPAADRNGNWTDVLQVYVTLATREVVRLSVDEIKVRLQAFFLLLKTEGTIDPDTAVAKKAPCMDPCLDSHSNFTGVPCSLVYHPTHRPITLYFDVPEGYDPSIAVLNNSTHFRILLLSSAPIRAMHTLYPNLFESDYPKVQLGRLRWWAYTELKLGHPLTEQEKEDIRTSEVD